MTFLQLYFMFQRRMMQYVYDESRTSDVFVSGKL